MIWTVLALLCVLGTKFLTSVRLRGLKTKLDAIQPDIDELRVELTKAEDEAEALRRKVDEKKELVTYLEDAVRNLETSIREPASAQETVESLQLMQSLESESAV